MEYIENEKQMEYVENLASPRIMKSHLPLDLLPPDLSKTCKVSCQIRSEKSVAYIQMK